MSSMHQRVDDSIQMNVEGHDAVLHALDYEDVALSPKGANLVMKAARIFADKYMPQLDASKLDHATAVALFVDRVFWDENSGALVMCATVDQTGYCLPIPKGQWQVKAYMGRIQ